MASIFLSSAATNLFSRDRWLLEIIEKCGDDVSTSPFRDNSLKKYAVISPRKLSLFNTSLYKHLYI